MNRREFVQATIIGGTAASALRAGHPPRGDAGSASSAPAVRLFPTELPELQWQEYRAAGFEQPVAGVIFHPSKPPCCGVPLGGISTGCIDLDVKGVYGFSSIFNGWSHWPHEIGVEASRMARKPPTLQPLLGLAVGGRTWVLTTDEILRGGDIAYCRDPNLKPSRYDAHVKTPPLEGVRAAKEIHYWGHYPVADLEFETDAPVSGGLRAWSPFIPGDTAASNIPATVFEVHLRNPTEAAQKGTLAFNFPGPDAQEALSTEFTRQEINEDFRGVFVASQGGVNYVLGVMGPEDLRLGSGLNSSATAWSKIATELPQPSPREWGGVRVYTDPSSSAAVDFSLAPGQSTVVRFLLAWYAPVWQGAYKPAVDGGKYYADQRWLAPAWMGDTIYYTEMYAARYGSALDVARRMAVEHPSLLRRVLAWQSAIYSRASLPAWLRDSLVNNLCLITEVSCWAQAKPPLGDYAYPEGAFALIESPRGSPDVGNIPCDWYGNLPFVYFFPDLAKSNLNLYKHFQREDGAAPFLLGTLGTLPDFVTPAYDWQISLNSTAYVDLLDRLWQRTGDDVVLREFYDSVKKSNTLTMNLRQGPGAVISMPEGNKGMEWFEQGEWAGMCTHLGGMHLAQLRIMERMARHVGDEAYAKMCQAWLEDGSRAMEGELWEGSCYLNFYEKESGKKSDDVMSCQLDGEWTAKFHGLPGVFRTDRVKTTLDTIKRCNIHLAPEVGAVTFARPDGAPLLAGSKVAAYGVYTMFVGEVLLLAMTYILNGEKAFGLDL
ncbi:MAG TPA: GH116 family glycosyl-hydrolase, partial [Terriglobia bacterium]|nr:GH116 family glycosyl-hydrolase [Terriglobia bacterium]